MALRNKNKSSETEKPLKNGIENEDPNSKRNVAAAHEQADEDIQRDPEFSSHSPNDDLDEAETARLGEDKTDLV